MRGDKLFNRLTKNKREREKYILEIMEEKVGERERERKYTGMCE